MTHDESATSAGDGSGAPTRDGFSVTVHPSGRQTFVRGDETVLDALLRANIEFSYGCKHGLCGACKARVRSGTVEIGEVSDFALFEDEREAGLVLLCCARPTSDLEIEGPDPEASS